jgi:drug/metabolite transporter (DMT)-like permease
MSWILASMIMFVASVVLYILVRKAALLHIPTEIVNLAFLGLPIFLYVFLAAQNHASLSISPQNLLFIFGLTLIGSYIPNVTSLKSIKYAPNPGYSLIISKSYVVFTTLVALVWFHSVLTLQAAIAIGLIVLFSFLIAGGKNKTSNLTKPIWLPLSLVSFFGWGLLSIGTKYAFSQGITIYQRLIYLSIFVTTFMLIELRTKKIKHVFSHKGHYLLLLAIGISSALFNYFATVAIDLAPNIGYVNAINASSISAVTIASALIYKDDLSLSKMIGILGVTGGLLLLIFK